MALYMGGFGAGMTRGMEAGMRMAKLYQQAVKDDKKVELARGDVAAMNGEKKDAPALVGGAQGTVEQAAEPIEVASPAGTALPESGTEGVAAASAPNVEMPETVDLASGGFGTDFSSFLEG